MNTTKSTPLTSLPPELLIHILSFCDVLSLASLHLVCKSFDALFRNPLNEIKRRIEISRSFVGELPSDIICYKDPFTSAADADVDDDDLAVLLNDTNDTSHLARLRRIYNALLRIRTLRNEVPPDPPHPVWGVESASDDDDSEDDELIIEDDDEEEDDDGDDDSGMQDDENDNEESNAEYNPQPTLTPLLLTRYVHTLSTLISPLDKVHRIKVDERNGFFICTSASGGLVVRDLEEGRVVWELPKEFEDDSDIDVDVEEVDRDEDEEEGGGVRVILPAYAGPQPGVGSGSGSKGKAKEKEEEEEEEEEKEEGKEEGKEEDPTFPTFHPFKSEGANDNTQQQGIYIITPYLNPPPPTNSTSTPTRPVELVVMRLAPSFMSPRRLIEVSCLQMSDTGVWVNYDAPEPPKFVVEKKVEVKVEVKSDSKGKGKGKGSGVSRYEREEEDDEMVGGYDEDEDEDEEMGDQWEDEEDTDDEALEPYPYGDDEAPEPNPYRNLDSAPALVPASRPGWVVDPRYPMVAIQFNDDGKAYSQAVTAQSSSSSAPVPASTSAKGKERAADPPSSRKPLSYHTPGKSRQWINQHFPLDTTPPSQFQVEGGKCKWNHAERVDGKRKLGGGLERDAAMQEIEFTMSLGKKRVDERGVGCEGVQNLPNGDMLVETEEIAGDTFTWIHQRRTKSEVHQIRFVPTEY
ncbi:hypothetical protein MD484_g8399, partial [Candolleomyces efflorescens]